MRHVVVLGLHVLLGLHGMHPLLLLIRLVHERRIPRVRNIIQHVSFQTLEVVVTEEAVLTGLTGTDGIKLFLHWLLIGYLLELSRIRGRSRWLWLLLWLMHMMLNLLLWWCMLLHPSLIIRRWGWKWSLFHFDICRRVSCRIQ